MSFYLKILLSFLFYSISSVEIYGTSDLENPHLASYSLEKPLIVSPLEEIVIDAVLATPTASSMFPQIINERIVDGERIPTIEEFRNFITQGEIEQVKKFLPFFPINTQDKHGNSFLHLALPHPLITEYLLENQIRTNLKTVGLRQETALERAERFQFREVVKLLKRHFASKKGLSERYLRERNSNPFFCNAKSKPLETKVLPSIGQ